MRVALTLLCIGSCVFASADRLILIPTGKKLLKGRIYTEWLGSGDKREKSRFFLGTAIGDSFDAELEYQDGAGLRRGLTGSFTYNYIVPVTDITPGISVGIRDIMNRTSFGRFVYLAATFRVGSEALFYSDAPIEFTVGCGTKPLRGAFLGISIPFANQVRLLAEHDSIDVTAGIEIKPSPAMSLRWLYRRDRNFVSVGWTVKL